MMGQLSADFFDAGHQTGRRIALAEILLHRCDDVVPRFLAEPIPSPRRRRPEPPPPENPPPPPPENAPSTLPPIDKTSQKLNPEFPPEM